MELSITKEKVLEAADKCPQAKETLKTLFPEVFKELNIESFKLSTDGSNMIYIADSHAPKGMRFQCFGLNSCYEWKMETNGNITLLIPTKK